MMEPKPMYTGGLPHAKKSFICCSCSPPNGAPVCSLEGINAPICTFLLLHSDGNSPHTAALVAIILRKVHLAWWYWECSEVDIRNCDAGVPDSFSKMGERSLKFRLQPARVAKRQNGTFKQLGMCGKPGGFKVLLGLAFWRVKPTTGTGTILLIIKARGKTNMPTSIKSGFQSTTSEYKASISFAFSSGGLIRLSARSTTLIKFRTLFSATASVTSGSVASGNRLGRYTVKGTWNSSARVIPCFGPAVMTS